MPQSFILNPPSMAIEIVSVPSSASEWTFTIPDHQIFLLHSVHFHFTASGAGANRSTLLLFGDGARNFLEIPIDSNIAPSATVHYSYATCLLYKVDTATDASTAPLPSDFYLPAGFIISTETDNLTIGDQYSDIFLYISPFILPVDRG